MSVKHYHIFKTYYVGSLATKVLGDQGPHKVLDLRKSKGVRTIAWSQSIGDGFTIYEEVLSEKGEEQTPKWKEVPASTGKLYKSYVLDYDDPVKNLPRIRNAVQRETAKLFFSQQGVGKTATHNYEFWGISSRHSYLVPYQDNKVGCSTIGYRYSANQRANKKTGEHKGKGKAGPPKSDRPKGKGKKPAKFSQRKRKPKPKPKQEPKS